MGIFGNNSGLEEMFKRYAMMEQQVQQNAAAAAPAPTPIAICPSCKAAVTIPPENRGKPLWRLYCLSCKSKLAQNPITIEFCVWLQNEWAEEIRTNPEDSG